MNQTSYAARQCAVLSCDAKLPGVGLAVEGPTCQDGPVHAVREPYQHMGGVLARQQFPEVLVADHCRHLGGSDVGAGCCSLCQRQQPIGAVPAGVEQFGATHAHRVEPPTVGVLAANEPYWWLARHQARIAADLNDSML